MTVKPKPKAVYTYRVEVYSNGKWVVLGTIKRPGALLPAWKGAQLGIWSGHVVRTAVQRAPSLAREPL